MWLNHSIAASRCLASYAVQLSAALTLAPHPTCGSSSSATQYVLMASASPAQPPSTCVNAQWAGLTRGASLPSAPTAATTKACVCCQSSVTAPGPATTAHRAASVSNSWAVGAAIFILNSTCLKAIGIQLQTPLLEPDCSHLQCLEVCRAHGLRSINTLFTGLQSIRSSDVNECEAPGACDSHADCSDTDGGFLCRCNAGWQASGPFDMRG
jgi:hypothetical protein